jgi:DNA-binding GntR family transcriptional regulator
MVNTGLNRAPATKRKPGPADAGRGSERAATELARYFTGGTFSPGDALPTRAELAEQFGLSLYAVRQGLALLKERGVITTLKGGHSTLTEARSKHVVTRDGHDPSRHLHPTGPANNLWQPASAVIAELFDIHDRAPLHIRQQLYQHRITGLPVCTARTVPADIIADIDPAPDAYGDRTALIKALTKNYGPLKMTERVRVIPHPLEETRTELGLDPEAPALEHRRLTRAASNRLLMIESEITDGTAAEWEYSLSPERH